MRRVASIVVVLPVLGILALAGGCVYDDMSSEMVVTEQVSVTLDEYRESGTLGSTVVVAEFADEVYKMLDKYDSKIKDIKSINVVSGTYRVARPSTGRPRLGDHVPRDRSAPGRSDGTHHRRSGDVR